MFKETPSGLVQSPHASTSWLLTSVPCCKTVTLYNDLWVSGRFEPCGTTCLFMHPRPQCPACDCLEPCVHTYTTCGLAIRTSCSKTTNPLISTIRGDNQEPLECYSVIAKSHCMGPGLIFNRVSHDTTYT